MSKFNTNKQEIVNVAGGKAYLQDNKHQIVGQLLTSFVKDQFYRSENKGIEDLKRLIETEKDKKFVAKASIYARTKYGMRSITHITAGEISNSVKGEKWTKDYFDKIVYRPDDMSEILSYYMNAYKNKPIPNSLKKGLAKAFARFDEYSLSKYKGNGKEIKLVDIANIVHPKHNEVIAKLMKGELKPSDTWETKLTQAGQKAETEDDLANMKADAWKELITEKKLGLFAGLRNIRNIQEQAPEMIPQLCELLTNENAIKKSLVMPFRFTTAYEELMKTGQLDRRIITALNKAVDISLSNVPRFDGKTLVVLDTSGSMTSICGRGKSPAEIGALFAAVLVKSNDADLMTFSDEARYQNVNPADSTLTIKQNIKFISGGTNFHSIFETANRKYDRIIILSDMQGWVGYNSPVKEFNNYCYKYNTKPFIYSWNLADQDGTTQFPEEKQFTLNGFSDKVFDLMKMLEKDKNTIIKEIESIEL